MVNISREEVANLATLSSLQLTEELAVQAQKDLSVRLNQLEQLTALDLKNVEPLYRVTESKNVWRSDDVDQPISGQDLVSLAADHKGSAIKVPKVL